MSNVEIQYSERDLQDAGSIHRRLNEVFEFINASTIQPYYQFDHKPTEWEITVAVSNLQTAQTILSDIIKEWDNIRDRWYPGWRDRLP